MTYHFKNIRYVLFFFVCVSSFAYGGKVDACSISISNTSDIYANDRCSESVSSGGYFSSASGGWSASGGADDGQGHTVLCVLDPSGTGTQCDVQSYNNAGFVSGGISASCGNTSCTSFDVTVNALRTVQLSASASGSEVVPTPPPPPPPPSSISCSPSSVNLVEGQNNGWSASPSGSYDWDYGSGFVQTGGGDGTDSLSGYWPTPVGWTTVSVSDGSSSSNCSVYVNNSVSPTPVPPPPPPGPTPPTPPGNSMSGYLYRDLNTTTCCSGVKNVGEPGLAGYTIDLTNLAETITFDTQVTDSNGYYSFTGLTGGSSDYRVTFNGIPSGYDRTTDDSVTFTASGAMTHNFGIYGNSAPSAPIISGPNSGQPGQSYTYNFVSTDADGDTIRYGVDYDDGAGSVWVPSSGYVNSGTSQGTSYTWNTTGVKNFRVFAEDSFGVNSGWVVYPVNISVAPPPTPQFSVNVSINVTSGGRVLTNPGSLSCTSSLCTYSFDSGDNITLTPIPTSSYWRFNGWAGDCSGLGLCSLNIDGDKIVTASFIPRVFNYEEF